MDDSLLIRKFCSEGDGEAAAQLLGKYERGLYQFIWQMLHHSQDCEDVMQETFSKALRALPRYREEDHFKSWLFRIGRNEAINLIRRRRLTVVAESPEEHLDAGPVIDLQPAGSDMLMQNERMRALDQAIAQLPDAEREVLTMRLQGDLPFKEIASIIGAPLGTVLARMQRAKTRLKALLEPLLNE
ncbi:sigma-70 family RNA polymerase sigma factor [Akkermansiaceae bacterium]|nr:sigma-70 family RNA polymerase sigma factor [Akkermansiaceae bacterium]MDC1405198.1 sigma-70 family RNA polymerase sigma factor [Akkermansiaceae bacterium]